MRTLLALVLSVLLSLAAQAEAVARSEMAGATDQTVCGQATLILDATGKPIAAHPCTHCLAASAMATLTEAPTLTRPLTRATQLRPEATDAPQARPQPTALARGPPVLM
jgi:hypothetical protein